MHNQQETGLTITETTNLWLQYNTESMDICVKRYILAHMEDNEIKSLITYALNISEQHIQKIKIFFDQEKYPLPTGFTDDDVNINAPRLYSDTFWLMYIQAMAATGMPNYALALNTSTRSDVRSYFTQCSVDAVDLFNKSKDILLLKGLLVIPPLTPTLSKTELIKKPDLLLNLFGKRTTLNGLEISHIFYNLQKIDMSIALQIGFIQVTRSERIKDFFTKLQNNVSKKHSDIFSAILMDDNITPPKKWASEVTNSTVAPFSDKLMLSHVTMLLRSAVLYYGTALSACVRKDLVANYTAFIAKDLMVFEDASEIMIDERWMELPPQTIDHEALSKT
jgi:hypothetical protein